MKDERKMFLASAATVMLIATAFAATATAAELDFDDFEKYPGPPLPKEWMAMITGEGQPRWEVRGDPSAPSPRWVLVQSGTTPKASFPLCFGKESSLKDGHVEVKFKAIDGKIDQAAGVVWRAKDNRNYYVCRANALEDNVVLYKVADGKRTALDIVGRKGGYGMDTKVTPREWHRLRVEFSGKVFTVALDGKELFKVEDATFTAPGMVGLWTKADSVTAFDDFRFGE